MWPTTEKSNGDEKACKVMQVKNETQTGLAAEIKIVFRFSPARSEEHTSELQSRSDLVCRLLLEKKKKKRYNHRRHQAPRHEAQSPPDRGLESARASIPTQDDCPVWRHVTQRTPPMSANHTLLVL